jgi:amidase
LKYELVNWRRGRIFQGGLFSAPQPGEGAEEWEEFVTSSTEIWTWDAARTATAIRASKISSRESVEAAIARMEAANPAVNAVVDSMADEALAAAELADRALRWGDPVGPLHGVPITVKINVDTAGRATTSGLVSAANAIASADSAPVANLREAGAIIVGRTNVPAFCYRWFTSNDLHGKTLNPWNPSLSPGGSSGGAAVASAIGIGSIAHGNDVAGSLRLPASACGIYGFKPTVGRLPGYNPSASIEPSLGLQAGATEGLMARSVMDLQLGLRALERQGQRHPALAPLPSPRADDATPCRVGVYAGAGSVAVHPEISALVRQAALWLEDAGYAIEEVEMPHLGEMADLWMAMLYAECPSPIREAMFGLGGKDFETAFHNTADALPRLSHLEFIQAWQRRIAIQRAWASLLDRYPVLIMPTAFQPTFPHDHDLHDVPTMRRILDAYQPLSAIAGLALPAISVPAGLASGAPAGVQIVTGWFREERCLSAAFAMEQRIGPILPIDPKGLDYSTTAKNMTI